MPGEPLPNYRIRARWVRVAAFPKGHRIGRYSQVIDRCWTMAGAPHSIRVAYVRDHPALAELDRLPHVPKVVKALYRGQVRLAHALAKDGWHEWRAVDSADQAWAKYSEVMRRKIGA